MIWSLDAAAKFLEAHPQLESATAAQVRELASSDEAVELGTRLCQVEDGEIVAERVVALRLGRQPSGSDPAG